MNIKIHIFILIEPYQQAKDFTILSCKNMNELHAVVLKISLKSDIVSASHYNTQHMKAIKKVDNMHFQVLYLFQVWNCEGVRVMTQNKMHLISKCGSVNLCVIMCKYTTNTSRFYLLLTRNCVTCLYSLNMMLWSTFCCDFFITINFQMS